MPDAARTARSDSRLPQLLDEAAWLFRQKGYAGTSVRHIVAGVGMLPGSLYCHFAAKEDLLLAIYAAGIAEISDAVDAAVAAAGHDSWGRFEAACCAHLDALLKGSDYPRVVVRILPADVPKAGPEMARLRDRYEARFAGLIAALPLAPEVDRAHLRRMVIGALNATTHWFRPQGDSPRTIAKGFVAMVRRPTEGAPA